MAQHDYVIANGTGAAVRSDLNNALAAIVSQNSGATTPSTTYAYQWWADTTTGLLKLRNAANSAWITLFQLDGEWSTIALENGTAAAPSIYFKDSGTDTGFYSPGTDQVGISTGGTARLYIDSNGNVNIDSNTLYVDAANNRVGLGTSAPNVPLQVIGSSTVTDAVIRATNSGGTQSMSLMSGGLRMDGGAPIQIYQGGSEVARIDTSGRLGIGATTVRTRLHTNLASDKNVGFDLDGSNEVRILAFNDAYTATKPLCVNGEDLRFQISGSEKARLDSSGRFLVGTSTALDTSLIGIYGNSNDAGDGSLSLRRRLNASNGEGLGVIKFGDLRSGSNYAEISAAADGVTGTNDYPGRLVFSTTADGASSPTERMRIANNGQIRTYTASNDSLVVQNNNAAGTTYAFFIGKYSATDNVGSGGTNSIYIYTNGNIQNTNNSYTGISDLKLKENIVDANSQWDDLKALQVRNYNFKEETGQQTHTQIGLVAQEVELVSPGLVTESPDRDEDGNDLGTVTKSVNYSVLYMKAVKALQEAMERIEHLETEMAAVKAQLQAS